MLDNFIKKSERDIIDIVKKTQNFKRKTNTYLGKI